MSLGNGDSQLDIDNILERLLKGLFMILLFYTTFIVGYLSFWSARMSPIRQVCSDFWRGNKPFMW